MYNFNNLEEMLRNGVTADEIAVAFTKNLNEAIDVAKRSNKRAQLFEDLANSWNAVVTDWCETSTLPDGIDKEDIIMTPAHAEELFTQIMELVAKLAPLCKAFEELAEAITPEEKPAPVQKNTAAKEKNENLNTEDFDLLMRSFLDSIK